MNKKKRTSRVMLSVFIIFAVLILILVNFIGGALTDKFDLKTDLTKNKSFQLDNSSLQFLKTVEKNVDIIVLAKESKFEQTTYYNAQAVETMKMIAQSNDNINISFIDYEKNPAFAAKYADLSMKLGDILLTSGDSKKLIPTQDLFVYEKNEDGDLQISASKAEEAVMSALQFVLGSNIVNVVTLTGHGEYETNDFETLLVSNNFETDTALLVTEGIDEKYDLAILAAPKTDLSEGELKAIDKFLYNDGKYGKTFFYLADAEQPNLPNIKSFINEWGVNINDGLVFETDSSRVFDYQPFYALVDYTDESLADKLLSKDIPMLMPLSRPLVTTFEYKNTRQTNVLLSFGESSGVRPADAGDDFKAEDSIVNGTAPAFVKCSDTIRATDNANNIEGISTVLVSSSVKMLDKFILGSSSFSNSEYIINLLNDVTGRENNVSLKPKSLAGNSLDIDKNTADIIGSLFVFLIPMLILALGAFIWLRRKNK